MSSISDDRPGDPGDALRTEAVTLASRIRIALPYRRATTDDVAQVAAMEARVRAAGIGADDEVALELTGLRETLEILAI